VLNDVLRFTLLLVILLQVNNFNVKSDTVVKMFCFVESNSPFFGNINIFTLCKLLDALIIGAVIVVLVLPVIFPKLILLVVILLVEVNVAYSVFKFESILVICVPTLLLLP